MKDANVMKAIEAAKAGKNLVNLFMAIQAMVKNGKISECSQDEMKKMVAKAIKDGGTYLGKEKTTKIVEGLAALQQTVDTVQKAKNKGEELYNDPAGVLAKEAYN